MLYLTGAASLLANAYLLQYAGRATAVAIDTRASHSQYAPISVSCPSTPLVRSANGISSSESTYITARKAKADTALAAWLAKTDAAFAANTSLPIPTLALAVSGGGLRSLLCGAGVIQALDSRDSTAGTNGIFQSLTYQSGLSGGAWLTTSLAGNDWPTISSLTESLWEDAFKDTLLVPDKLLSILAYADIVKDVASKDKAGFDPTIVDIYGRLLGYQLLEATDGGVATSLSDLTSFSNFTLFNTPFPIITARGLSEDQCVPASNATQYEFNPYEFGSWDNGVEAFTQTAYLGSALTNGSPTASGVCTTNYDNLGYIAGTSSDVFNEICSLDSAIDSSGSLSTIQSMLEKIHDPTERDLFAVYPNPFYKYPNSSLVSAMSELNLVDGSEGGQNIPIWPLIQEARQVDVLIVSDNSADTSDNFPNGTEIYTTFQQAQAANLTRMPFIPSVDTFITEGLNKRATFFGCDDAKAVTIIYLPNNDYTYASNVTTLDLRYKKSQTKAMIANGNRIATQDDDKKWPTCFGCAVMKKSGSRLPSACTACFDKYCYSA